MRRLPYLVAMDQMKTGDFIQVRGSGTLSHMIMHFSAYSHSMAVIRYPDWQMAGYPSDRVQIVESTVNDISNGLQLRNYRERFLKDNAKGSEWYWMQTSLTEEQRARAFEFYIHEVGRGVPYDFNTLIRNILGYVPFGTGQYICSELVFAGMIAIGAYCGPTAYAPRPGDLDHWLADIIEDIVELIGPAANVAV